MKIKVKRFDKKIIAILGLPGSGKTEVINYLMKKHNWPKVYFGDVTFDEMEKTGLEINEKNERAVREGLRVKYGRLHYAEQVIQKIENIKKDTNILVESLYDWNEYKLFKKKFANNFITIAIYSSPETRHKRLGQRSVRPLTLKEAQSRDYSQIENLFQAGPIAMANWTVINESSLEKLHKQINKIITGLNE